MAQKGPELDLDHSKLAKLASNLADDDRPRRDQSLKPGNLAMMSTAKLRFYKILPHSFRLPLNKLIELNWILTHQPKS